MDILRDGALGAGTFQNAGILPPKQRLQNTGGRMPPIQSGAVQLSGVESQPPSWSRLRREENSGTL
jgi:hypothetical protein